MSDLFWLTEAQIERLLPLATIAAPRNSSLRSHSLPPSWSGWDPRVPTLAQDKARQFLGDLPLDVRPLSPAQALIIGDIRAMTRPLSSSSRDRACLAPAIELEIAIKDVRSPAE